jgi:hypothetical protein
VALSAGLPVRALPGILLFGARTFLKQHTLPAITRLAILPTSSYLHRFMSSTQNKNHTQRCIRKANGFLTYFLLYPPA